MAEVFEYDTSCYFVGCMKPEQLQAEEQALYYLNPFDEHLRNPMVWKEHSNEIGMQRNRLIKYRQQYITTFAKNCYHMSEIAQVARGDYSCVQVSANFPTSDERPNFITKQDDTIDEYYIRDDIHWFVQTLSVEQVIVEALKIIRIIDDDTSVVSSILRRGYTGIYRQLLNIEQLRGEIQSYRRTYYTKYLDETKQYHPGLALLIARGLWPDHLDYYYNDPINRPKMQVF